MVRAKAAQNPGLACEADCLLVTGPAHLDLWPPCMASDYRREHKKKDFFFKYAHCVLHNILLIDWKLTEQLSILSMKLEMSSHF
jgi:hypothetical protein